MNHSASPRKKSSRRSRRLPCAGATLLRSAASSEAGAASDAALMQSGGRESVSAILDFHQAVPDHEPVGKFDERRAHAHAKSLDWTRLTPFVFICAQAFASEPWVSMPRQASSITAAP